MNARRSTNDPPQQWSVQAQFTISHPGIDDPNNAPQTHTVHDSDSVRMFYTWNSQPDSSFERNESIRPQEKSPAGYKFQKGNLLFTSEPPIRKNQSSGYGSDIFSPCSSTVTSIPTKALQQYNQKCKSSCSIVLSTVINEQPEIEETESCAGSHCDRTQSLRCQIPTTKLLEQQPGSFYGCGDPWCYHSDIKRPSRASTFSPPSFEHRLKDAAVQTFEMVDKCTSPFLRTEAPFSKKKRINNIRSTTEPIVRKSSQSSFTPDSLENYKLGRRLLRSNAVNQKSSGSDTNKSSDPNKKPRTVHIDVYCTGTEQESDTNSSSEIESKTASSPQTVFESQKLKVTHHRSGSESLPFQLHPGDTSKEPVLAPKPEDNDSDNDDNTSTAYPSQISSYSALAGLSSFASTIPSSWSAYSVDNTSLANTSWKDTYSDIDSLNPSRSSIALTDSLDLPFVSKGLSSQKSESIEEHPEALGTPSIISLNPSDSFEYENSEDRLRIKQMEKSWNTKPSTHWKSPQFERSKYLFQQQKLNEYVEKRLKGINLQKSESKDSDSGSDVSEKGWSFIKSEAKVEQPNIVNMQEGSKRSPSVMAIQAKLSVNPNLQAPFMIDPGIYTKQRNVAKKFGSVVDVFKKPGHHIGPAKNPECQCDHCRIHYQSHMRGRTQSAGEVSAPWTNWRRNSKQLKFQDESSKK